MPKVFKNGSLALRAANFIAQYHHVLVIFVLSSFLSRFLGEENLGWVIAGASALVALGLFEAPRIFTRIGTTKALFFLTVFEIAALIGLATARSTPAAIVFFTLQALFAFSIFIGLDLLLEAETRNEKRTGNARGAFLTISNLAALVATLSLAWISVGDQYARVFLAAAGVLVPFSLLVLFGLPKISYVLTPTRTSFKQLWADLTKKDSIWSILVAHFLLQIFFAWMVIYVPLFLHTYIGFSWPAIGLMLAVAMLPYVLFEYLLGWIADNVLGEKELLIAGFILLGITTIAISFLNGAGIIAWAFLLFLTRVGAAMVEVMTETHFFRAVNHNDTGIIGLFRMLRPLSGVLGPVIASIVLLFIPLPSLFIVFGIVLFIGVPTTLAIKDFR